MNLEDPYWEKIQLIYGLRLSLQRYRSLRGLYQQFKQFMIENKTPNTINGVIEYRIAFLILNGLKIKRYMAGILKGNNPTGTFVKKAHIAIRQPRIIYKICFLFLIKPDKK